MAGRRAFPCPAGSPGRNQKVPAAGRYPSTDGEGPQRDIPTPHLLNRLGRAMKKACSEIRLPLPGGVEMVLCRVECPKMGFRMGARGAMGVYDDKEPVHTVTIPHVYYLGKYPVTQEQYRSVASRVATLRKRSDPSYSKGERRPVENVNWFEANLFCAALSDLVPAGCLPKGHGLFCLPTEAEWEHACRAGTDTEYHTGDGEEALREAGWFDGNAGGQTRDVDAAMPNGASPSANGFGLVHVHGNVWEWCHDVWELQAYRIRCDGDQDPGHDKRMGEWLAWRETEWRLDVEAEFGRSRVIRGGSWGFPALYCRSAIRYKWAAIGHVRGHGFRVCFVPVKQAESPMCPPDRRPIQDPPAPALLIPHSPFAMNTSTGNKKVINWSSAEAEGYWDWDAYPPGDVRKVVIGPGPRDASKPLELTEAQASELLRNLGRMTGLTHLYLWNIHGLTTTPSLPSGLKCLDIRGCKDLHGIRNIPQTVETVVVEGCPGIRKWPEAESMGALGQLRELRIEDTMRALEDTWFAQVLGSCDKLETLDLGGSVGLTRIDAWPPELRRVILNRCRGLENLPESWPKKLYRAEIAETSVHQLPTLTPEIDYLNVAGARNLRELGEEWHNPSVGGKWPRTLYLHGSGILAPPASEHGESDTDNVTEATRAYFEDIVLVGSAEVRRCKVLMLGNGSAGKTSLSLVLQGEDVKKAKKLGSTHGVLFWQHRLKSQGARRAYNRHIWDFGGQDIYHNAHRLFVSAGAVFVVLWDPAQDGEEAPMDKHGFQDVWRPLSYWLGYIRMACPYAPEILVVCNRHAGSKLSVQEIRTRFDKQCQACGEDRNVRLCVVDLWERTPEGKASPPIQDLQKLDVVESWVDEAIQRVIAVQGTKVPSYWKIAEAMVSGWLAIEPNDPARKGIPDQMKVEDFAEKLDVAIREAVKGPVVEHPKLAEALRVKDGFELTGDRIRRTLSFLSHVGLVFWHHRLFHKQVIIRQEWALNAVYSVLDRREHSPVYRNLQKLKGRFTAEDLRVVDEGKEPVPWGKRYQKGEQDLLLSLMVRMGICFPLVPEARSYWGKALYVSIAHLPWAAAARVGPRDESLPERFESVRGKRPVETKRIQNKILHEGRWFAVLAQLGEIYGREGHYARDAFLLESNRDGQSVFIEMGKEVPGEKGGAMDVVTIHVVGKDASDLAKQLQESLGALLEGRKLPEGKEAGEGRGGVAGTPQHRPKVFISYARDEPEDRSKSSAILKPKQYDYTTPVLEMRKWAKEGSLEVKWSMDDTGIEPGESISNFIDKQIEKSDKVLVVHSDRYWLSPHCMYEFTEAIDLGGKHGKNWGDLFLMVELETSGIWEFSMQGGTQVFAWEEYADVWEAWKGGVPLLLANRTNIKRLKAGAIAAFNRNLVELFGRKEIHWKWDPSRRDAFEKWLGKWFKREAGS